MSGLLWLIPILPALGFLVNGLLGSRMPKKAVSAVACAVVLVSFVLSALAVIELAGMEPGHRLM